MKLPTLALAALACAAVANADIYAGGSLGTCTVDRNNIEVDGCKQFEGILGYEYSDKIDIEARYNILDGDITGLNGASNSKGTYGRKELKLGATYTFNPEDKSSFYAGAFIGRGKIESEFVGTADKHPTITISADSETSEFLYGFTAGYGWSVKPNVSVFAETAYTSYLDNGIDTRYHVAGNGATGELHPGGVMGEDRSYDLKVGFRYRFD
jgi:hypothetical protein